VTRGSGCRRAGDKAGCFVYYYYKKKKKKKNYSSKKRLDESKK